MYFFLQTHNIVITFLPSKVEIKCAKYSFEKLTQEKKFSLQVDSSDLQSKYSVMYLVMML